MSPAVRLTAALGAASAYSAFPAAFYHLVQDATGSRWTTALLFAAHGVAQVAAMTLLTRGRFAARATGRTGPVVAALLLADALGAVLLVVAPEPGGFALLLAGRVVTGCALGALAPLATGALAGHPRGPELATVAILGAVGAGSLAAGALAAAGWSRTPVLAVGLVLLPATALLVRGVRSPGTARATGPAPAAGATPAPGPAPSGRRLTAAVLLAFACNGVLGLFCSTLPGVVAGLAHGAAAAAGATTGLVMLSAGGARLALGRLRARAAHWLAVGAAGVGAVLEVTALAAGHLVGALAGAALLGAAAGIGFDAALRAAGRAGVPGLARVQRGGQAGLVLPVLAYPVVTA